MAGGSSSRSAARQRNSAARRQPIAGRRRPNGKITIDDFAKIELRVGQVKVAERVPKADKLAAAGS